ncbi:hypothetical protein TNCV_1599041 [Trichonephila clavipes]|nr:hypothetical protein TNCV_1599041 [Trichonephila clavipes]
MCLVCCSATLGSIQSKDYKLSRRPVPGRPRATTPAEDRFIALSARRRRTKLCRSSLQTTSIRKKNLRYYGAKSSQCRSVCKKTSCVRSFQRTTAKNRFAGQENMFLGRSNNGRYLLRFPDLQWKLIQASTDLENSALDSINPTLLKDTVIEVVESWFGQGNST